MKEWPTERMRLNDLIPAEYNSRVISKKALEGLTSSLQRFGLVEPIVWNKRTGNIVGGHQRYKILRAQGIEETDVVVVDLPESEEIALNVTLNNPHIQGDWTDDVGSLLEQITESDEDIFGDLRLDKLERQLGELNEFNELF